VLDVAILEFGRVELQLYLTPTAQSEFSVLEFHFACHEFVVHTRLVPQQMHSFAPLLMREVVRSFHQEEVFTEVVFHLTFHFLSFGIVFQ